MNIQGFELLKPLHTGRLLLNNGVIFNYGVIRIDNDEVLVCYTGLGLYEILRTEMTDEEKIKAEKLKGILSEGIEGEQKLIESGHIARIQLNEIDRVID